MLGTIGPDVARAAVALQRTHPLATAQDVLDVCLRQRSGALADFGDALEPGTDFSLIVAAAFDTGMPPEDWRIVNSPNADPLLVSTLRHVWRAEVLPRFAGHYGLTP